ncbi:hypothetical protein ONZ45_g12394 [Pleurotus djamor]|nr:hypothetical protein ONZ45_g12394 [Pleurotus djamor]
MAEINRSIRDISIKDFLQRYMEIIQLGNYRDQTQHLVNYALAGVDIRRNELLRFSMVGHYCLLPESGLPTVSRDFDSVIGFTPNIPVRRNLYLYPLAPQHLATITANMHVQVPFHMELNGADGMHFMDPSHVPNILLGMYGNRHQLRLFCPRMRADNRVGGNRFSVEEAALLYDEVIQPSIEYAAPLLAKDWPPALSAERWRARARAVGYQASSYILARDQIDLFNSELVRRLEDIPQFRGALICTQIQGIKATTMHTMNGDFGRQQLERELRYVTTTDGHWWVDVAVELQDGGQALLWRDDTHITVLSSVLDISYADASIISTSDSFTKDINSHLLEVAGLHTSLPQLDGSVHATYIQLYTTDKSLTFHRHGNQYSQNLTPKAAMAGTPPKYLTDYAAALVQAKRKNVAARLEMRVPFEEAFTCLRHFSDQLIRSSVISVGRENWWSFRLARVNAASRLLQAVNSQSVDQRINAPGLSLVAAVVWLVNGIHSRPDDHAKGRACNQVAVTYFRDFTHAEIVSMGYTEAGFDELRTEYEHKPFMPMNAIFMRRIYFKPESNSIRLSILRVLHPTMIEKVFGQSEGQLKVKYGVSGILQRSDRPKERHAMNKGVSRPYNGERPTAHLPAFEQTESIESDPVAQYGPDVDLMTGRVVEIEDKDIPEQLQDVYIQYSQGSRQAIPMQVLKTSNLANLFTRVQARQATQAEWDNTIDILFPPKGTQISDTTQGWNKMLYMDKWLGLLGSVSDEAAVRIRTAMHNQIRKLSWIPKAKRERPWRTNRNEPGFTLYPTTLSDLPAPHLLMNPRYERMVWIENAALTDADSDSSEDESEEPVRDQGLFLDPTTQLPDPQDDDTFFDLPEEELHSRNSSPFGADPPGSPRVDSDSGDNGSDSDGGDHPINVDDADAAHEADHPGSPEAIASVASNRSRSNISTSTILDTSILERSFDRTQQLTDRTPSQSRHPGSRTVQQRQSISGSDISSRDQAPSTRVSISTKSTQRSASVSTKSTQRATPISTKSTQRSASISVKSSQRSVTVSRPGHLGSLVAYSSSSDDEADDESDEMSDWDMTKEQIAAKYKRLEEKSRLKRNAYLQSRQGSRSSAASGPPGSRDNATNQRTSTSSSSRNVSTQSSSPRPRPDMGKQRHLGSPVYIAPPEGTDPHMINYHTGGVSWVYYTRKLGDAIDKNKSTNTSTNSSSYLQASSSKRLLEENEGGSSQKRVKQEEEEDVMNEDEKKRDQKQWVESRKEEEEDSDWSIEFVSPPPATKGKGKGEGKGKGRAY